MRVPFDDDNSRVGVEGWFEFKDEKLIFFIKATNSREDWISNFIAFREYDGFARCKVHKGFKKYARWMDIFIISQVNLYIPHKIYVFGYSMGGGIAQILGEYDYKYNIISIDGPRTTTKIINNDSILFYNKGSLVHRIPFWFKRIKDAICLNNKWQPFWKSHANYDIDEIIKKSVARVS